MLQHRLPPRWRKCVFGKTSLVWCGRLLAGKGFGIDPKKAEAIKGLEEPSSWELLDTFLGMCDFHRRMVPKYAEIVYPLTSYAAKRAPGRKFKLEKGHKEAVERI